MKQEPDFMYYYKNDFRPLASLSLHEVAGFDCPPGYVLPLNKPDAYGLYYVKEGKGVYILDGAEFPVANDDLFALYPDTEIVCRSDEEEPFMLLAASFNGADALLLLNAAGFQKKKPVRHLDEEIADTIMQFMTGLYTFRGQDIYGTTQSTSLLYAFMSMLVKTATWDQTAMPPGWTGVVHVQKALDFISENYFKPISVNDIAEYVGLTRSRLYKVFSQHVFISPQQYLMEYRIREARNLLEKRGGSIKEISNAVGIEDPLYFSKVFKQMCGRTPTEYMKNLIEFQGKWEESELIPNLSTER
ncbi:MAG: AraC family transcriptional regulator [Treponema sp.]|nr:AraC family transcriptional regulator [Treponema sp.]